MALTQKKRLFADEYLKRRCRNATEAAKQAGYSERSAYGIAYNLLQEADVRAYIDERLAEYHLSANEVLALLSDQAYATIEDFVDIGVDEERFQKLEADLAKYNEKALDVTLPDKIREFAQDQVVAIRQDIQILLERNIQLNLDKARDRNKLHLVKALKPTANGMSIELHDSHAALVDLGRYHKLFTDKSELGNIDGQPFKLYQGVDVEEV